MVEAVADFAVETSLAVNTAGVNTAWGVLGWGGCREGRDNSDDKEASQHDDDSVCNALLDGYFSTVYNFFSTPG